MIITLRQIAFKNKFQKELGHFLLDWHFSVLAKLLLLLQNRACALLAFLLLCTGTSSSLLWGISSQFHAYYLLFSCIYSTCPSFHLHLLLYTMKHTNKPEIRQLQVYNVLQEQTTLIIQYEQHLAS